MRTKKEIKAYLKECLKQCEDKTTTCCGHAEDNGWACALSWVINEG